LADTLLLVEDTGDIDRTPTTKEFIIPPDGFILEPNKLYLGVTQEIMGSEYYVTSLGGRNRIGRLGMFVQICADLGQLGKSHRWTLEINVIKKLKVYPFMQIGKVTFWMPKGEIDHSDTEFYATKDIPYPSTLFEQIHK
jgi:dCTP deaminase